MEETRIIQSGVTGNRWVSHLLEGGKKHFKQSCKEGGGLDAESATCYERLLAVALLLTNLDVWRRNTQYFLT